MIFECMVCLWTLKKPSKVICIFFLSQGLEWHNLRSKLTTQLASTALGDHTVKQLCIISDELIEKIREKRVENVVEGFEKVIYRCGLEGNFWCTNEVQLINVCCIMKCNFFLQSYLCHFVWSAIGCIKQELDPTYRWTFNVRDGKSVWSVAWNHVRTSLVEIISHNIL
jgi:hypothetical protein